MPHPDLVAEVLKQQQLERVSPKMERFREPWRIKLARGGRGAGAKSRGAQSIAIQIASRRQLRVVEFREVQKSLKESSYQLVCDTIKRLRYPGWRIGAESIRNEDTGSLFVFEGLRDIRAANQIKSFEGFDLFLLEEAATISNESLSIILPTLRKEGSELWGLYNPEMDPDPITERLWNSSRDDVLRLEMIAGPVDNPWWTKELQKEMDEDYARDPDEAEHVWGGQPRKQGQNSVMSRVFIQQAMAREVEAVGRTFIGVDVARFGDDKTVMFKRKGLKTLDKRRYAKQDTMQTAYAAWDFAEHDASVVINVDDTGVGGGVTDRLAELGAQVNGISFGANADDKDKYGNLISQMWFDFPVFEADIPEDPELKKQLAGRRYTFDNKGRRVVESKDEYKKRYGNSPDDADALLLTYYQPAPVSVGVFDAL